MKLFYVMLVLYIISSIKKTQKKKKFTLSEVARKSSYTLCLKLVVKYSIDQPHSLMNSIKVCPKIPLKYCNFLISSFLSVIGVIVHLGSTNF